MSSDVAILIDANNHVHPDARAPGATLQRVGDLFRKRLELFQSQLQPATMVVCFDGAKSWRRELETSYKSNRGPTPGIVADALALAAEIAIEVGAEVLTVDEFEADDLLATLAEINVRRGLRVVLSTTDKDARQLLSDGQVTQMRAWRRDRGKLECEYLTAAGLQAKYGLNPAQWLDVQSLQGDNGDKIDGCQGFGDKTASDFVRRCGSLVNWRKHMFSLGERLRHNLVRYESSGRWRLVRQLVTLRRDVPLPATWLETCV